MPAPPISFDPPLALAPGQTLTVTQDHEGLFALILTTASGETIELPFCARRRELLPHPAGGRLNADRCHLENPGEDHPHNQKREQ